MLDEATTHLDHDTIMALIEALRIYAGAILLVSHDRHFTRCVIEGAPTLPTSGDSDDEESEDEECKTGIVYAVGKGKLKLLSGGIDEYILSIEKRIKKQGTI